ncbi:ferric reductase-like transmembrane domain-containing protein [Streptomyces sp. B1-3]|uniref:ferric reductase-like transmembrane domain-containing protein n=1 Tax=Streptomyces sp. B1-3 TaxID=3141453 RepID=UPI003D270F37
MTASTLRAARPDRREQLVDAMTGRGALFTLLIASFLPFLTPLADLDAQRGTARQAGLVVGSLALMTLWWQVILGVRRVSQVLRMDRATAVRVHAALGTAGVLLVLLHPLLMAGTQNRPLAWLWQLDFRYPHNTFVTFGKLAAALFAVVWISSTIAKRLIRYRSWRAMHLLTYPLAVLVFAHSWGVRTLISDSVFVNAYWWVLAASLAAAMGLQLIHRLRPASGHASTIGHDGDVRIVEVSVPPRLQPAPGQFVYVRSTRLGRASVLTDRPRRTRADPPRRGTRRPLHPGVRGLCATLLGRRPLRLVPRRRCHGPRLHRRRHRGDAVRGSPHVQRALAPVPPGALRA